MVVLQERIAQMSSQAKIRTLIYDSFKTITIIYQNEFDFLQYQINYTEGNFMNSEVKVVQKANDSPQLLIQKFFNQKKSDFFKSLDIRLMTQYSKCSQVIQDYPILRDSSSNQQPKLESLNIQGEIIFMIDFCQKNQIQFIQVINVNSFFMTITAYDIKKDKKLAIQRFFNSQYFQEEQELLENIKLQQSFITIFSQVLQIRENDNLMIFDASKFSIMDLINNDQRKQQTQLFFPEDLKAILLKLIIIVVQAYREDYFFSQIRPDFLLVTNQKQVQICSASSIFVKPEDFLNISYYDQYTNEYFIEKVIVNQQVPLRDEIFASTINSIFRIFDLNILKTKGLKISKDWIDITQLVCEKIAAPYTQQEVIRLQELAFAIYEKEKNSQNFVDLLDQALGNTDSEIEKQQKLIRLKENPEKFCLQHYFQMIYANQNYFYYYLLIRNFMIKQSKDNQKSQKRVLLQQQQLTDLEIQEQQKMHSSSHQNTLEKHNDIKENQKEEEKDEEECRTLNLPLKAAHNKYPELFHIGNLIKLLQQYLDYGIKDEDFSIVLLTQIISAFDRSQGFSPQGFYSLRQAIQIIMEDHMISEEERTVINLFLTLKRDLYDFIVAASDRYKLFEQESNFNQVLYCIIENPVPCYSDYPSQEKVCSLLAQRLFTSLKDQTGFALLCQYYGEILITSGKWMEAKLLFERFMPSKLSNANNENDAKNVIWGSFLIQHLDVLCLLAKYIQFSQRKAQYEDFFTTLLEKKENPELTLEFFVQDLDFYIMVCSHEDSEMLSEELRKEYIKLYGYFSIKNVIFLNQIAQIQKDRRNYPVAYELFNRNLLLAKSVLGLKHLLISDIMMNMGDILLKQGQIDNAKKILDNSLEIRQNLNDKNGPKYTKTLEILAEVYLNENPPKNELSLENYQQSAKLKEEFYQAEHPEITSVWSFEAQLLLNTGKPQEAELLINKSYQLRKKLLGQNHFLIAESMEEIANLKLYQKEPEEQIFELLTKAMNMRKSLLKQYKMPETAYSCIQVAKSFARQDNIPQTIQFFKEALKLFEFCFVSQNFVEVGDCYYQIALFSWLSGQPSKEDVQSYFEETLKIYRVLFNRNHIQISFVLNNYAIFLVERDQTQLELAYDLMKEALRILDFNHQDNEATNIEIANACCSLGQICYILKLYKESNDYHERGLAIQLQVYGTVNAKVGQCLNQMGHVFEQSGFFEKANQYYIKSIEVYQEISPKNNIFILKGLSDIGNLLQQRQRYHEARQKLQIAAKMIEEFQNDKMIEFLKSIQQPSTERRDNQILSIDDLDLKARENISSKEELQTNKHSPSVSLSINTDQINQNQSLNSINNRPPSQSPNSSQPNSATNSITQAPQNSQPNVPPLQIANLSPNHKSPFPIDFEELREESIVIYKNLAECMSRTDSMDKAEKYFEMAIQILLQMGRKESEMYADCLLLSGRNARKMKNFWKAKQLLENSRAIMHTLGIDDTMLIAEILSEIGQIQSYLGMLDKAQQVHERALQIYTELINQEDEKFHLISEELTFLGHLKFKKQEFKEAEVLYNRALKIDLKLLNLDEEDVIKGQQIRGDVIIASDYSNIANVQAQLQQYETAIHNHQKAYMIMQKQVSDGQLHRTNPEIATCLTNMANCFFKVEQLKEAAYYYEKAVAIDEEHFKNLGTFLKVVPAEQNVDESKLELNQSFQSVLTMSEDIHGDYDYAVLLYNLGSVYYQMNCFSKSLGYMERSFTILNQVYGKQHQMTQQTQQSIDSLNMILKQRGELMDSRTFNQTKSDNRWYESKHEKFSTILSPRLAGAHNQEDQQNDLEEDEEYQDDEFEQDDSQVSAIPTNQIQSNNTQKINTNPQEANVPEAQNHSGIIKDLMDKNHVVNMEQSRIVNTSSQQNHFNEPVHQQSQNINPSHQKNEPSGQIESKDYNELGDQNPNHANSNHNNSPPRHASSSSQNP